MTTTRVLLFVLLLLAGGIGASPVGDPTGPASRIVELPVSSSSVNVVASVPAASAGREVTGFEDFPGRSAPASGGKVRLELNREPVYVLDGPTDSGPVDPEASPFGAHPALVADPRSPFGPAQEIGIRWHRGLYAYWIRIQPTREDIRRGIFHWEANDREWGAVPRGMAILANIGLPERLQDGPGPPGTPFRPPTVWKLNESEADYLTFVRAVVERYDGDGQEDMPGLVVPIRYWQFENEPDGWRNRDWKGYAHLQRITYQAIKQACPQARVLIGGQVEPFQNFFEPALRELGGKDLDIFDLHYYGTAAMDWKELGKQVVDARIRLDRLGYADTPIWITETGTYSGTPGDERVPVPAGLPPEPAAPPQSEREQARDLVKRYVVALSAGAKKVFWAFGVMEGFQNTDGFFDHTGLLYDGRFDDDPPAGTPKLAYYSYGKMTRVLEGADWSRARRLDLGPDVYAFEVPKGSGRVTILWYDPGPISREPLPDAHGLR